MTPSAVNALLSIVGGLVLIVGPAVGALLWVSQNDQVDRGR